MDKKVVLTAAVVVAFILSSCILVTFFNPEAEDREINIIARVNTDGSGIYLDDTYNAADFVVLDTDGNPVRDADGKIQYNKDAWRGKVFGTTGPTSIQHIQLMTIVTQDIGLSFRPYTTSADTSSNSDAVYYVESVTSASIFETNSYIDGGIIWEPQFQALLHSETRRCISLMTSDQYDPGHNCCVIAASHSFITDNSDQTVRFLAAYIETVDWINSAKSDPNSADYQELVNTATRLTGLDRTVVEAALNDVTYTYGLNESRGDTATAPLASLEQDIENLANNLASLGRLSRTVLEMGFSSVHEFSQRFVNDGYLSQALAFEYNENARYAQDDYNDDHISVAVISGDVHQIAIHLGNELGIFDKYGIDVHTNPAANGAGVATSVQNGSANFGFVGAPPLTITVVNGGLSTS